jgi:hypothetical protein
MNQLADIEMLLMSLAVMTVSDAEIEHVLDCGEKVAPAGWRETMYDSMRMQRLAEYRAMSVAQKASRGL